jgi:hypothetical protein
LEILDELGGKIATTDSLDCHFVACFLGKRRKGRETLLSHEQGGQ